jgi:transcriptional regulator with XRE-family HTH domain
MALIPDKRELLHNSATSQLGVTPMTTPEWTGPSRIHRLSDEEPAQELPEPSQEQEEEPQAPAGMDWHGLRRGFAERMVEVRTSNGLTRDDIARHLGVSVTSVHYMETGRQFPELPRLVKLAELLGVEFDWLVRGAPEVGEGARQALLEGFGARLREARIKAGLTQEALGLRLGVTKATVSNYETERRLFPHLSTLMLMPAALGVDIDWLVMGKVSQGEYGHRIEALPEALSESVRLMLEVAEKAARHPGVAFMRSPAKEEIPDFAAMLVELARQLEEPKQKD